jgi:hypothetical protein
MSSPPSAVRPVRFPAAYGWVRNLMASSLSVHLSSEAEAIILDGTAEYVTDPSGPLAGGIGGCLEGEVPAVLLGH